MKSDRDCEPGRIFAAEVFMRFFQDRLWGPTILTLALSIFALSAPAAITPESDVLLPWFEIDVERQIDGLATTFSVVNGSPKPVHARLTVYTNWGIPVLEVPLDFDGAEAKSVDLGSWLAYGQLPKETLSATRLQDLRARLTGKPSPIDGLYYSSPFQDGIAVGYVIVQTLGSRPDSLWGDTYTVDAANNFFEAETLVALTDRLQSDCKNHGIRVENGGRLLDGAELIIWSGRRFEPSLTPNPIGPKVNITIGVYDQSGRHLQDCTRELIAVEPIQCCDLEMIPTTGWLNVLTEDPTFILQHLHSTSRASAELHSYCLREDLKIRGPGIALEAKVLGDDADGPTGPRVRVGDDVEFEYYVTNDGTVPLTAVSVTDDSEASVTCPTAALEPGESMVCKAVTTALGCVTGTVATASGTAPDGAVVKATDPAFYTIVYEPRLAIDTLVNGLDADQSPGPTVDAGQTLHWTFVVTNTGDASLSEIAVIREGSGPAACPKSTLEPGESMTCSAESLAAEGQQHEVGSVSGRDPCSGSAVATDPVYYFGLRDTLAIALQKYVLEHDANIAPGPLIDVGTAVQWQFVVTNPGNLVLTNVTVTDPALTVSCPKTVLDPGESMTCTASSVALPCQQANTATAKGQGERGPEVSATDTAHYFGQGHPAVALELKVNGDPADDPPGPWIDGTAPVLLTYEVTNAGDVTLTNVVVADDPDCPKTALGPGESMTCTAIIVAVPGAQQISGTVDARPPCGDGVQAADPAFYQGGARPDAGIGLVKLTNGIHADTPPGPSVPAGSVVIWTYAVTNPGSVPLTGITVTDGPGITVTCPRTTLAPAESMICTASGIAQSCQNTSTGTASGQLPGGEKVSASDVGFYYGVNGNISVSKNTFSSPLGSPPGPWIVAGSEMSWRVVVTNTGQTTLTDVSVTDDRASTVTCPKTVLQGGESMTCEARETVPAGPQRSVTTATGTSTCGNPIATFIGHYRGGTASMSLESVINGEDADDPAHAIVVHIGELVQWSMTGRNTGQVDLHGPFDLSIPGNSALCDTPYPVRTSETMTCFYVFFARAGMNCFEYALELLASYTNTPIKGKDPSCYIGQDFGSQGCTTEYWKNHLSSWQATGYSPTQTVGSVFARASHYPALANSTLLGALSFTGDSGYAGYVSTLLRESVAALLNGAHPDVAYWGNAAKVIANVDAALRIGGMLQLTETLERENHRGCPLN